MKVPQNTSLLWWCMRVLQEPAVVIYENHLTNYSVIRRATESTERCKYQIIDQTIAANFIFLLCFELLQHTDPTCGFGSKLVRMEDEKYRSTKKWVQTRRCFMKTRKHLHTSDLNPRCNCKSKISIWNWYCNRAANYRVFFMLNFPHQAMRKNEQKYLSRGNFRVAQQM